MRSPPLTPSGPKVKRDMTEGKEIVAPTGAKRLADVRPVPPTAVPIWIWPHLLSLDAPAVAIGWQAWWAHVTGIRLGWPHHVILGLSVWAIYLADRLADSSRTSPAEWGTQRHEFYHRQRGLVGGLLTVAVAGLIILAPTCLTRAEFSGGALLLGIATLYFWQIHVRASWPLWAPKEAVVGGLFAVGAGYFGAIAAGPTWLLAEQMGLFGTLCFLNCALITRWERTRRDRRDRSSMLNAFPRLCERLGVGAALLAVGAAMTGVAAGRFWIFAPLTIAAAALAALDFFRTRLPASALRVLSDVALLTPWAFLWLS